MSKLMSDPSVIDGQRAWRYDQVPEAINRFAESGLAILGCEARAVIDGKPQEFFPGNNSLPIWDTAPRKSSESWSDYCRRTITESLREFDDLDIFTEDQLPLVYFHLVSAYEGDPLLLVPRSKMDIERAETAVLAGWPAVEPVLGELLEWLQDFNWPVAQVLTPFLASVGLPLLPHIRRVFKTDDEIWKHWIILNLISESRPLAKALVNELKRIADSPNQEQIEEELHLDAREVLTKYGFD